MKFTTLLVGVTLLIGGLLSSTYATDFNPDKTSDAQSVRTPYGFGPVAPVQLNNPIRANDSSVPAPDSAAAATRNYFFPNYSTSVAPYYVPNYDPPGWAALRTDPTFVLQNFLNDGKASLMTSGVDPFKLTFATQSEVRVYFVEATAGYRNALGFVDVSHTLPGVNPLLAAPTSSLIFPLVGTAIGNTTTSSETGRKTANSLSGFSATTDFPLLPMDYVTLGTFNPGSILDFFILPDIVDKTIDTRSIANASTIFFTDPLLNVGDLITNQHFQFYNVPGHGILAMVEDLPFATSDTNFYDLSFLIQVRPVPEPQTYLVMGMLLIVAYLGIKKRKIEAQSTVTTG